MRLTINIDNYRHEIDSTDPETLGRWIVEILARAEKTWTPATYVTVQVQPTFIASPDENSWRPDWITDNRIISEQISIRTPADLLAALQAQLEKLEAL
jgi:hypothetical protein